MSKTQTRQGTKSGEPSKNLPGRRAWPLNPSEWDFRGLPPAEIKVAAYYEYATSCDWILDMWQSWMDTPFPSWKRVHLNDDLTELTWNFKKTRSVAHVLTKHFRNGIPRFGMEGYDAVTEKLVASIPVGLRGYEFEDILFAVPAFPTPWLELDKESKKRLKARFAITVEKDPAFYVFGPSDPVAAYRDNSSYANSIFEVAINWDASDKRIVTDFEKWLAPNYKKFGHEPKGAQGWRSSNKYERLRWLTAWRLARFGLDYTAAQELLTKRNAKVTSPNPNHDLPIHGQKVWGKVIKKAKNVCQMLFPSRSW